MLPFTNMCTEPEQEFFGDGIAEDVITALPSYQSLFVIARNSCFTDVKQVGASSVSAMCSKAACAKLAMHAAREDALLDRALASKVMPRLRGIWKGYDGDQRFWIRTRLHRRRQPRDSAPAHGGADHHAARRQHHLRHSRRQPSCSRSRRRNRRSRSAHLAQPSGRGARPTRGCLVDKRGAAPIPARCSADQQAPLAGEAHLRFDAAVEPSISDFSPSTPP